MKKIITMLAMLVLIIVLFNQENVYAEFTVTNESNNTVELTVANESNNTAEFTVTNESSNTMETIHLADNISVVKPIEIHSYDSLSRSTITKENIFLLDSKGNKVSNKLVLTDDLKTVMIVPTKPLNYSAKYTVSFSSNVKTLTGYHFNDTLFTVTTEAKPKNAKLDVTKVKKPSLSDQNLEYLISAAFTNKDSYIVKWNTGLEVALLGSPTAADKAEVTKVLKEISALTGLSTKVTTNKNKANVKMYFGTQKWGEKHVGKMPVNTGGYFLANTTKKAFIYKASLFVNTQATATYKKHIIRKNLTMTLGLPKQTLSNSNSIFYEYGKGTSYSNLDKLIIKALYSPYIPQGTTPVQLREMFRK